MPAELKVPAIASSRIALAVSLVLAGVASVQAAEAPTEDEIAEMVITGTRIASPNATSSWSTSSDCPKARRNTHSDAASSSQLRAAQNTTRRSSSRSEISSSSRVPSWRSTAIADSGLSRNFPQIHRMIRSARP